MIDHSTGIRVLLAPPSPEGADLVTPAYLRKMVDMLRETHDWVIVDLPSGPQRPLARRARRRRPDPGRRGARDHHDQERAPLPGGRRPARLRALEAAADHQPVATPPRASASATWRPPSDGRSTARSSRTAAWRCSQSTVACRSSSRTRSRRSRATSSRSPVPSSASQPAIVTQTDKSAKRGLFARR